MFYGKNKKSFQIFVSYFFLPGMLRHYTCMLNKIPANSVDPDQLASEEANWSGSALFVNKYVYLYQQSESSSLIGWKLEMGMAS